MSLSSEDSDAEELPRPPFLAPAKPRAEVLVLSSDSDEEPDLPLFRRLAAAAPSRDPPARPQKSCASRAPPAPRPQKSSASREPPERPQKSSVSRDPTKEPQPKKAKKSPGALTVRIDPVLLQDGSGGEVLSALQAQDVQCVIQPQPLPRSISWSRTEEDVSGDVVEEAETLLLVPAEEFLAMVEGSRTETGDGGKVTLQSLVGRVKASKPWAIPTLVVMEVEKYFRDQNSKSRKKLKDAVQGGGGAKEKRRRQKDAERLPQLSRVDVEEALTVFQLQSDAHVCFLETWKEFSDFVCMFTKALIEAPTKRQRDHSSVSFYLDGEWAGGVRVDRCGKGLLEVWKRQIQQFNRVSAEVASAVVAAYPSPQLLVKAYHQCHTQTERHNLLSDLLVRRGEGVTSTSRRVGPETSKRIYLQLMCSEPELSLDN